MMDPAERSAYQHTGTGQQRQHREYNGQDVEEIGQEQYHRDRNGMLLGDTPMCYKLIESGT